MAQILDLGKIRFQYKGNWSVSTEYQFNDVVNFKGSAYVYISTAKTTGTLTSNSSFWGLMAKGSNWEGTYDAGTTYGLGSIAGYQGSLYQYTALVSSAGNVPTNTAYWSLFLAQSTSSNKVYYVAPHGSDTSGAGFTLAQPFLTIKYACTQVPAGSTIFVKTGTYLEQLPITVPQGVAIIGDNQRTTIVQPKSGNDDTGQIPNSQSTMFYLSDGSILNKMTFQGLTGWSVGSTPSDITTSTVKGVFVRLNPSSPVSTKSPYILECAAIGSGAVGALVDGSVHATGNKSMVFHGYTCILDNGVGYWCKDNGKAEIVSCFTYYAYFGYSCTGGGQIRALNGNNSYGTYGVTSQGFDTTETTVGGQIYGSQMNFTSFTGTLSVGDTVSNGAGATALVTSVQTSSNKIYIGPITGTFTAGNTITSTSGGSFTLVSVTGQKGFTLVLSGLTSLPVAGASISLTGDAYSYVIQSVSGTWSSTASVVSVVLAQEKPDYSAAGTAVLLRYKYSRVRLTGHDFLSIGTGGVTTTNYPNTPTQNPDQAKETLETFPGRVFFVNTDQDGNFRVGKYFAVNQATGSATLNANAFNLSGLTSLRLGSVGAQLGAQIDEFSTDASISQNSTTKVPTQSAVRGYFPQIASNVIPAATATNDLGSSTKRWNNVYGVTADFSGALTVGGNLTVNGTTTTINSTTLNVDDKNIELGAIPSPTDTTADGGGIDLFGTTTKSIRWDNANANWTSSEHLNLATGKTYKIANVTLLSPTSLGSTVVSSSLTSVGTLTGLTSSGVVSVTDTTASSSTTTGSLKTAGGLGVAGAMYAGSVFDAGNRVVTTPVANTFTAKQTFNGSTSATGVGLVNATELVTISSNGAAGTVNIDTSTQSVLYYTGAATGNFTLNVRHNSGTALNSVLNIGESITVVFLNTNTGTAYYPTAFTVDGTAITPKWQGGTAPTGGNASAVDAYAYTVIKTGTNTYTVLGSQTKYV